VAADRVVVVVAQLETQARVHVVQRHDAIDEECAIWKTTEPLVGVVVLVADLADQFLQAVLQRDDAAECAEFVGHDRHVAVGALHLAHQLCD